MLDNQYRVDGHTMIIILLLSVFINWPTERNLFYHLAFPLKIY